MSQKSIKEIDRINAEELTKIKGHPQIAVMTVNETDNIEEYAQDQFDRYKFGHAGYDNGVLVVFAIKNRQIRIQTGYGVESIITDAWAGSDAVDGQPKEELRAGDYGQAAVTITKRISKKLSTNIGDIKTKEQIATERKQQEKDRINAENSVKAFVRLLALIGLVAVMLIIAALVRRKKYFAKVKRSAIGEKYKLSISNLFDDDLATYLYDNISNPNEAAEFLVLDQKLRYAKKMKYIMKLLILRFKQLSKKTILMMF